MDTKYSSITMPINKSHKKCYDFKIIHENDDKYNNYYHLLLKIFFICMTFLIIIFIIHITWI